jgi:DNA polymerase-3 subunit delta'
MIAAEKATIQIDQVRALQADAALTPLEGRHKVFIIQEIERATLPAANALLKILEEPSPHVILVLTSTRRDRVLPTILSRCQVIGLRPLPLCQIQEALTRRGRADRPFCCRLSGALGWAVVPFPIRLGRMRASTSSRRSGRDVLQRLSL